MAGLRLISLCAFSLLAAAPACAQSPLDLSEPVQLFMTHCVATNARPQPTQGVLGGAASSQMLGEEALERLNDGVKGGSGWYFKTRKGNEYILHYLPPGRCTLRVHRTDPQQFMPDFNSFLSYLKSRIALVGFRENQGFRMLNGVNMSERTAYLATQADEYNLTAAVTSSTQGEQQAILTLVYRPR